MHPRARRLGEYVMTDAKQARLKEIAQQETDRDLATLNAQKAKAALLTADEKVADLQPSSEQPAPTPAIDIPKRKPATSTV